MEEQTLDTLIDHYLLGTISPLDKTRLEKAMADDPSVAALVEDSKRAYQALLLERNRIMKEKLKMLDKEDMDDERNPSPKWKILFSAAGIMILLFLTLNMYQSPLHIARRNLIAYPGEGGGIMPGSTEMTLWADARTAFIKKDFEKAIQHYLVLAENVSAPGHFEAKWNILMVQLAAGGPTPAWYLAMDRFSHEAPSQFSNQANRMMVKLTSTYYRFFFSPWKDKFSSLKPRLI